MAVAGHPADDRILLGGVVAGCLAGIFKAWSHAHLSREALIVSVFVLAILELTPVGTANFVNRYDKTHNKYVSQLRDNKDIADFLHAQPGPIRVAAEDIDDSTNIGDLHSIATLPRHISRHTFNPIGGETDQ